MQHRIEVLNLEWVRLTKKAAKSKTRHSGLSYLYKASRCYGELLGLTILDMSSRRAKLYGHGVARENLKRCRS